MLAVSTGMSTLDQIDHAVDVLGKKDLILLHACSVYPAHYHELNLNAITNLSGAAQPGPVMVGSPGEPPATPGAGPPASPSARPSSR